MSLRPRAATPFSLPIEVMTIFERKAIFEHGPWLTKYPRVLAPSTGSSRLQHAEHAYEAGKDSRVGKGTVVLRARR